MKRYLFILSLLITIILTGCHEEKLPTPVETDSVSLEVTANINDHTLTRSIIFGTSFSHEARIRVVSLKTGGTMDQHAVYACKNPNGTSPAWVFTNQGVPLTAEDRRIVAFYPAGNDPTTVSDPTYFTPTTKTTQDIGSVSDYNSDNSFFSTFGKTGVDKSEVVMGNEEMDYMTGADQLTPNGSPIYRNKNDKEATLSMKHCMAIVVFHVYKSGENTNLGIVKKISIKNKNASAGPLREGKFAYETNTFTPGNRISYERTMSGFPDGCYYGMMVYPAIINGNDVVVELIVDQITYTLTLPAKNWESGNIFLYNVQLLPTKAELVDEVKVFDWETGENKTFIIE